MTAQQLIEAAYARSTANDPGKLAGDSELLGVADRLFQTFYAILAAANPDGFLSRQALVGLAGSPASAALPTDVIDVRRVQNATGGKVNLVPADEIDNTWHLAPAVYRVGLTLVTRGNAGDPILGDVLTAFVVDAPATLAALATVVDARFPVRHHGLVIDGIALYLDSKDAGRNMEGHSKLRSWFDAQLVLFLQLAGLSTTALSTPHAGILVQRVNGIIKPPAGPK